ncbi:MAG: glycoside hydrolase family protein, partial [Fusobacteriaceae bacterium]
MELSSNVTDRLRSEHKLYLSAYSNADKIPAIGYGTVRYPDSVVDGKTGNVKMGDKVSKHDAEALFDYQMQIYIECVDAFIKAPLSQNQFDA